jgi:hypothetical protein
MAIVISAMTLWGIVSIIFGIMVLAYPKILNYLIALYLIISGMLLVFQSMGVGF